MKKILAALFVGFVMVVLAAVPMVTGAPSIGRGSSSGLSHDEATILKMIDYQNAWNHLAYLSSLGEKAAGTAQEAAAQQYVYDQFSSMPVDEVWWETFPVEEWKHYGTTVKVASNGDENIPATIYGSSPSIYGTMYGEPYYMGNANDGKTLVAELVDAGLGLKADFDMLGDLDGAIALVHRDDDIQAWPDTCSREAVLHGASAVMFYGYYNGYNLPQGIKQDSVFSAIPAISISPNSAAHLQELLSEGPVTLQIDGKVDIISAEFAHSINVAAVMWGATKPNEYVIISGHVDTWWNGTSDNGSSIAAVLEFARLLSEARAAGLFINERTIIFTSVGAEEVGGPDGTWYNWLVGSYEFVVAHPDIMEGLVVELNMDGVSFTRSSGRYWIENTWETNSFVTSAIGDLGMTGMVSYYNPIWSWTDAWSFGAKGGGSAIQMMWMAGYDLYYHTQYDDMDHQGTELLPLVLKLHGLMAMRASQLPVMPLDLTATCDWAAARLKAEKMSVPAESEDIAEAAEALSELRETAVEARAYGTMLADMYSKATTPEAKAEIMEKIDALNKAVIDARRIVTPWTIGEGGVMGSWDVFLRPDQHVNDLSYVNAAMTALSKGQVGNAIGALENVYSMQWGKYFSLETYEDEMDSMDQCFMYWGDDFDQQQAYVDVYPIWAGLKDGSMSKTAAYDALSEIKNSQLVPWLETDLGTLAWAWGEAAEILGAGVP